MSLLRGWILEQLIVDLMKLVHTWVQEKRLVIAVLHDTTLVNEHFPNTLILARQFYREGATQKVMTKANIQSMIETSQAWEAMIGEGSHG